MKKTIIAIDPGAAGAVAWSDGLGCINVQNMPDTPTGILELIREICSEEDENGNVRSATDFVCYIEDVGRGIPGQSSSATATFARHCGHLEMALIAERVKMCKLTPQKWMKSLGIGKSTDCDNKREWKNKLKRKCEELYPQFKITLKNSDALLILDYAIRNEK